MNKPVEVLLIGAGERGAEAYGPYALRHPDQLRFIAVAEPDPQRRDRFATQHHIPGENLFPSWEPLLARPKFAQAALVCTQDQQHTSPTLAALQAGYDVLLEKPMATTAEECRQLIATASQTGRQLHVCHVLRYTRHFQKMREIIQSGILGEVIDVAHRENVSYSHMAHSYVRGHWANQAQSSPMILAKCCHDFDILIWLLNGSCERVSSVGSLMHFRPENAPAGAPAFCLDGCPAAETCLYYAPFVYIDLIPLWRSVSATTHGFEHLALQTYQRAPALIKALSPVIPPLRMLSDYRGWPRSVITHDPTPENVLAALKNGPYGRCVYHCDNDVVDHQVVMMEFSGGASVTLTMHGHSHIEGRTTRIEGTLGTLNAQFGLGGAWIEVLDHRSDVRTRYITGEITTGHGGGDEGLMAAFLHSLETSGKEALTTAQQALTSHLMAFAADEARLGKRMVDLS